MATYDRRTGLENKAGQTKDYSNVKDQSILKYSDTTGQKITQGADYKAISADALSNASPLKINADAGKTDGSTGAGLEYITASMKKGIADAEVDVNAKKTARDTARTDLETATLELGKQPLKEDQYLKEIGADKAKLAFEEYESQLEGEKNGLRRKMDLLRQTNPTGALTVGLQSQLDDMERKSLSKQADIAILGNAQLKKWDTLSSIVDRKVKAETEYLKSAIEAKKLVYQDNKDEFTLAEQRLIDSKIKQEERAYTQLVADKTEGNKMIINALQGGAPKALVTKAQEMINNGATPAQVATTLGAYSLSESDRLDKEIKRLQKTKLSKEISQIGASSPDAPTIKTINGVDKQWNPKTQTWDNPTSDDKLTSENVDKSLGQLAFLKNTANSITGDKEIYGASGRSGARKFLESTFVGSTDYTKLVGYTDTLKVNVMSLMTDPTIKKFFGPQMSNADVQLMTSAGTTLNPELQDPATLKTEAERLYELMNRMETSVKSGTKEYQYVDTIGSIDLSGTALNASSYANQILKK